MPLAGWIGPAKHDTVRGPATRHAGGDSLVHVALIWDQPYYRLEVAVHPDAVAHGLEWHYSSAVAWADWSDSDARAATLKQLRSTALELLAREWSVDLAQ